MRRLPGGAICASTVVQVLLLALVYFAVARASLGLSFASTNASPVWPPSGIALAALLLGGTRLGVGVLVGAFTANLVTFVGNGAAPWGTATLASFFIAVGNVAEALLAAWATRRFIRGALTDAPQGAYVFAAATLGAAMVSATCGVATLVGSGMVPREIASTVWLTWWLGDVTGLLVITPLLLQLRRWRPRTATLLQCLPTLVLFVVAGGLTFGGLFSTGHVDRLMAYGLVVAVAWAAYRHGALGAATATFGIAVLSIAATIRGHGPFAKATVNDSLISLDGFLALCAITGMVLAASLPRRDAMPAHADKAVQHGGRLPAAMLLACLAATVLAWHLTAADTERRATERFATIAEDIQLRILERMNVYEQALRGGRGLFDASTSVERDEWRQYVKSLTINENYPGIQGIGFSVHIPAGDKRRHIEGVRAESHADYDIRPPGERAEYTSIVYLEPQDQRNRRAIGYDMFAEPVRRAAMEQARDSGDPSLSGKVTLVQEIDKNVQAGFLMFVPVYRRGMPVRSAPERQAALTGYVYGPFRMGDLMQGVLQHVDLASVSLNIFDGEQFTGAALMYANTAGNQAGYPHQFAKNLPLLVAGHRWTVQMKSTQAFEAAVDTQKAQIALVAGTIISLLLFTVVRSLAVTREEALTLAQRMSAARAEAERRFESLAESASDCILVLDERGKVEFCNRAGTSLLGQSAEQLAGRDLHSLLKLPRSFEAWKQACLSGSSVSELLETIGRGAAGAPTPVEVSLGTWAAQSGQYFSVTARDISSRRQAEEALRDAMREARQASLAKSEFLANMSHEIRTPMNAVIGLSYLLGQTTLDSQQAAFLAKIELASSSLLAVINNVLDLSKIEAGELVTERAPFDLPQLLAHLAQMMAMEAQAKSITFDIDAPLDLPTALKGDATRLNQVLTNLLANAIKFTDRGGVTLRVRALASTPGCVSLRFCVEDSGIGIAPEAQARLFAPFAQADASTTRRYGGTGLGLSIVKRLTELMGGVVGFSSTPGAGSEFWVELDFAPASPEALALCQSHAGMPGARALTDVRVLIVDDSDINLDVAKRILELEGAHATLAGNGREACEQLRASPHAFDVVLMDVQMPVLDGYEATRRIRGELGLSDLPIIALTAGALTSERQRATDSGMDDFVTKPFDPRTLVRSVLRHVRPDLLTLAAPTAVTSAAPAAQPWPAIDGIDSSDVSERLGGDTALFRSMLNRLLDEFIDVAAAVEAAAPAVHAGRMHKLRGSAAMLGAKRLQQAATDAETACRAGDAGRLAQLAAAVDAQLRRLRVGAAPFLDNATADASAPADADRIDPRALVELAGLLRQQSLSALVLFNVASAELRRLLGQDSFDALRRHIDNLEFSAAASVLEQSGVLDRAAAQAHG